MPRLDSEWCRKWLKTEGPRALVLVEGSPRGDDAATWAPCEDYDRIMDSPDDDVLFFGEPDAGEGSEEHYRLTTTNSVQNPLVPLEIVTELRRRYPRLHEETDRVYIRTCNHYMNVQDVPGYSSTANYGGRHFTFLEQVDVSEKPTPEEYVYNSKDVDVAVKLCLAFGGSLRLGGHVVGRFSRHSGRYSDSTAADELADKGCYVSRAQGYAVLKHDPAKVRSLRKGRATRKKRREERAEKLRKEIAEAQKKAQLALKKAKKRRASVETIPQNPGSDYLVIADFWDLLRKIYGVVGGDLAFMPFGHYHGWVANMRRWQVMQSFQSAIKIFNRVYGRNAHRVLPEFQKLLDRWRVVRVATQKHWDSSGAFDEVWAFFDRESEAPKPRKGRSLELLQDRVTERTDGIWQRKPSGGSKNE